MKEDCIGGKGILGNHPKIEVGDPKIGANWAVEGTGQVKNLEGQFKKRG